MPDPHFKFWHSPDTCSSVLPPSALRRDSIPLQQDTAAPVSKLLVCQVEWTILGSFGAGKRYCPRQGTCLAKSPPAADRLASSEAARFDRPNGNMHCFVNERNEMCTFASHLEVGRKRSPGLMLRRKDQLLDQATKRLLAGEEGQQNDLPRRSQCQTTADLSKRG